MKLLMVDKLYHTGFLQSKSDLITTLSRHKISCIGEDNLVDLPLILKNDYSQLSARRLMHLGLITIGVIGLTRQGTGAKTFISVSDMAWNTPEDGVLGCMELDMNNNYQIGVLQPGMIADFADFPNRFRVHVMTKGYDIKPGTCNLWVMIGFIGKTTDTEKVQTKLDLSQNLKVLTNKGVPFVTALRISSERRQGEDWILSKLFTKTERVQAPRSGAIIKNTKTGEASISFSNYEDIDDPAESDNDEEN
ncbi:hypothetical protein Dsin_005311 [Dipteronia sinensis]|uniref:Movement protein n=1 Tax=Dipteronia sinensis TaxID=43782 RepID=A0AAE0AXJ2_9ROSI|nr:hypothetical protein Dsin_005311 [Dipteronia sinensis]